MLLHNKPFETGHALLIGVGSYPKLSRRWQAPTTANDAQALAAALQDEATAGYPANQVVLLHHNTATKAKIFGAFDRFAETLREDDTFVFFYSGHGHHGSDNTYYLTTFDTEVERVGQHEKVRVGTGISQAELLTKLRTIKAKKVLLIFNACHSGELMPTLGPGEEPVHGENVPEETGKALLGTGEGRVLMSACRPNQYSFIGSDTTTLFTQALVEGLQGTGVISRAGYISIFDLYGYLYDAVADAVHTKIPEHIRALYGGTQEPTLSIIRQVGPFPVALYKGQGTTLGAFQAPAQLPADTAVTEVSPAEAKSLFRQLVQFQATGSIVSAGGDIVYGDKVGGDKVNGDKITVGDISGSSGIAIGRGASARITTGFSGIDVTQLFQAIYQRIDARPDDPDVHKDEITAEVKKIQQEANAGDTVNENRLGRLLRTLAGMAPDIFEVTVACLTNPMAGFSTVVKKIAAKAKVDQHAAS